jgi:DNA-binding response OmpR family regulator
LEALLQLCWEKPKGVSVSTQVTLLQALDLLEHLTKGDTGTNLLDNPPVCILVMACDPLANQAIVHALGKGLLGHEVIEDPSLAAQALNNKRYDLILLDVATPQIDGLEFANHIQKTAYNKNTPLLYLTNIRDFENRISAKTSDGRDLIVLPFSFIELTVKTLCLIFHSKSSSFTGK